MPHKKHISLVWMATLLAGLASCNSEIGELKTEYHDIIVRDGTEDFNKKRWAKANEEQRGKMLASLLRHHKFIEKTNADVYQILGDRTCYWESEEMPCYWVILEGEWYLLGFRTTYKPVPGTIVDVSLYPRDTFAK